MHRPYHRRKYRLYHFYSSLYSRVLFCFVRLAVLSDRLLVCMPVIRFYVYRNEETYFKKIAHSIFEQWTQEWEEINGIADSK
jgi:hypothetical protein